jgi:hypothetical protein
VPPCTSGSVRPALFLIPPPHAPLRQRDRRRRAVAAAAAAASLIVASGTRDAGCAETGSDDVAGDAWTRVFPPANRHSWNIYLRRFPGRVCRRVADSLSVVSVSEAQVARGTRGREAARAPEAPPSSRSGCRCRPRCRGLHSFTSQLNLSAFYGIGGACRGCVAHVQGVLWGVQGV